MYVCVYVNAYLFSAYVERFVVYKYSVYCVYCVCIWAFVVYIHINISYTCVCSGGEKKRSNNKNEAQVKAFLHLRDIHHTYTHEYTHLRVRNGSPPR